MSNIEVLDRYWAATGIYVKILKLSPAIIDDKLAILSDGTGHLSFVEYESFLGETCLLDLDKAMAALHSTDEATMVEAAIQLKKLVLEVNPLLDPELLVVNKQGRIKVPEQCDSPQDVTKLVENSEWPKARFKDLPDNLIGIDQLIGAIPLDFEIPEHDPSKVKVISWENLWLFIRTYEEKQLLDIFEQQIEFTSDGEFKNYIVSKCLLDYPRTIMSIGNTRIPEKLGGEKETIESLYNICVSVNPFLLKESLDLKKIKRMLGRKKSGSSKSKGTGKEGVAETSESRKFDDISEKEIENLPLRLKSLVIGQNETIEKVCEHVQLASCGLKEPNVPIGSFMFTGQTGVGKCHGRGTPILMYDGTIKKVEDVLVGDRVMGDDSTPRTVVSLARGQDEMFVVIPTKGESFVCNKAHILSLKNTTTKQIINISIEDYINKSGYFKHLYKLYRVPVEFANKEVRVDPYFMGLWAGDGNSLNKVAITTADIANTYNFTSGRRDGGYKRNPLLNTFRGMGLLVGPKEIPFEYISNSRKVRLELLAGVVDSDGSLSNNCYDITLKDKVLFDQVVFLAQTLGFSAYASERTINGQIYYRTTISGNISEIPVRLLYKQSGGRKQKKDVLVTGLQIKALGVDEYFGFNIDGNSLYCLGDCTVTHNSFLSRVLAKEFCGDEHAIIRIDCSEYSQGHEVMRLVGASPSYIGYDDGGQLTNAMLENPFRVILFDEIEKGHRKLHNMLLQIMDAGRLTSGKGEIVSFEQAIIIMTSNVGINEVARAKKTVGYISNFKLTQHKTEIAIKKDLKATFSPEFLNRIDGIYTFNKLNEEDSKKIIALNVDILNSWLKDMKLNVSITDEVIDFLFSKGFDEDYGARPLKRALKREVMLPLSKLILKNKLKKTGSTINVSIKDNKITFVTIKPPRKSKATSTPKKKVDNVSKSTNKPAPKQ